MRARDTAHGTATMHDRWLSVDEIGEYLGVGRDTVYAWISGREMPAHRVGRLWVRGKPRRSILRAPGEEASLRAQPRSRCARPRNPTARVPACADTP